MRYYLLLSTAVVLLNNSPAFASNLEVILGTHTPHLPLELKSTPSNSFKIAAICALGDEKCGLNAGFGKSDNDSSTGAKKCRDNGFLLTQNCQAPKIVGKRCPHNTSYSKPCYCPNSVTLNTNEICTSKCDENCIAKSTCDNGFIVNTAKDKCLNNIPPSGSSFTTCSSCQIQTATGINEAGNRYYSCRTKTCNDSGYNSNVPANNKCSSTNVCGNICFNNCYKPTCSEGGYTNNIPYGQNCSTISFYSQTCYENCKPYCSNGAIYYSDRTCSITVEAGKTPIGVVFDEANKLVMALDETKKSWNDGTYNYNDIPALKNYQSNSSAFEDINGKYNTKTIIEFQKSSGQMHYAADYCYNYSTDGTRKGDWFLPTRLNVSSFIRNTDSMNITLNKLKGNTLGDRFYWTSTEWGNVDAWDYIDRGMAPSPKYVRQSVRPVMQF